MSVVPSPWHSEGEEVSDVVLLDDDSASRVASSVAPSPRLVVVGDDGTATTKPSSSASTNESDASDDADPNGSHDQEVLEEAGSDYEPTYEETVAYARWLGIKPHEDARMMRIAKDGLRAKLPPDWKPCRTGDGQVYYFNFTTGESDWDHPCDGMFRAKVEAERLRAAEAPSPSSASEAVTDVPTPSSASVAKRDGRDEDEEEGDEGENASTGGVVGVGVEERHGSTRSSGSFAHATPKPPSAGKSAPSPRVVGGSLRTSPDIVATGAGAGVGPPKRKNARRSSAAEAAHGGAVETTVLLELEDFSLVESFRRSGGGGGESSRDSGDSGGAPGDSFVQQHALTSALRHPRQVEQLHARQHDACARFREGRSVGPHHGSQRLVPPKEAFSHIGEPQPPFKGRLNRGPAAHRARLLRDRQATRRSGRDVLGQGRSRVLRGHKERGAKVLTQQIGHAEDFLLVDTLGGVRQD